MSRSERIERLVADLDSDVGNVAEEAQWVLTEQFGTECLEPLLEVAPAFASFGRLCAIEVFLSIGDPRAGSVITPWLTDENEVVREWTSQALGALGVLSSVPALERAWKVGRERPLAPDGGELRSVRGALAQLGAREVVVPESVRGLAIDASLADLAWRAIHTEAVLRALAEAEQVILRVAFMHRGPLAGGKSGWFRSEGGETWTQLDWERPWDSLVVDALDQVLPSAHRESAGPSELVQVEWMDRSDL